MRVDLPVKESLAAEYSILQPLWSIRVQSHLSSPWSYCTWCLGLEGGVAYFLITLSSIRAAPRNREKQPGLQRTQPRMCSVAFCSQ